MAELKVFTDVPSNEPQGYDTTLALTSASANQNLFGVLNIGNNRIKIDGQNGRIIINDGEVDRVLIGFLANGF